MGFLKALFQEDQVLNKEDFRTRMVQPECSWILSDTAIRMRYKRTFSCEKLLNKIEKQYEKESMSHKERMLLKKIESMKPKVFGS